MSGLSLDQIPLFAGLSSADRLELEAALERHVVRPGTPLMREGEPGDSFVIILQGQVDVIKAQGSEDERLLRALGPGAFLGEMSLFSRSGRRTATAVARTEVAFLSMSLAQFDGLLARRPQLAYEIVRVMSLRLREADNSTIRDLHEKNVQLARAYEALQAAQAQVIEKERLEQELRLAGEIQRSMLPQGRPAVPGFDFGAVMVPAHTVGGDFFDFILLDRGRIGIVVADVSDKGMPAAIFMALSRSLLRVEAGRDGRPAQVLRAVNAHLLDMNEAGMFLSVVYGILDTVARQFSYARAGHELPLLFDAAGEPLAVPMSTGQLLGLFDDPVLDEQTVSCPGAGRLVIFTDGVTDAVNAQQIPFGLPRLRQAIRSGREVSAQALCERTLEEVTRFRGEVAQFDDFTMVVVNVR